MGGCCSRIVLNDTLAYSTPRLAKIRDWRLGALHMFLLSAVFAYIVLFTIVFSQRYRRMALDVVGSARLQLRPPRAAYWQAPANLSYCNGATNGGVGPDGFTFPQLECRFLDQFDATSPFLEANAMFVSSRVSTTNFTYDARPECGGAQLLPSCVFTNDSATSSFYVGDLEMFTLLLDHVVSSPMLRIARSSGDMPGRILDAAGKPMNPCDDYTQQGWACDTGVKVGQVGLGADILPLRTLLRAAGITSLDARAGGLNETMRFAGIVLILSIEYSNAFFDTSSFSDNDISYTYSVLSTSSAEFKAEQVMPEAGTGSTTSRVILDRHGLRIVVKQSGTIGVFDFPTLLITLTSSLGLLAITTLVVDFLATRVLPLRNVYAGYKTWQSLDVADLAHLSREDLQRFAQEDLINPQPAFFSKIPVINQTRSLRMSSSALRAASSSSSGGASTFAATGGGGGGGVELAGTKPSTAAAAAVLGGAEAGADRVAVNPIRTAMGQQ